MRVHGEGKGGRTRCGKDPYHLMAKPLEIAADWSEVNCKQCLKYHKADGCA